MSGRDVSSPVIGSRVTLELCRAWVSLGTAVLTCLGNAGATEDLDNDERQRRRGNRDMSALAKVCALDESATSHPMPYARGRRKESALNTGTAGVCASDRIGKHAPGTRPGRVGRGCPNESGAAAGDSGDSAARRPRGEL